MYFANRQEAGKLLASSVEKHLHKFGNVDFSELIIAAIPRGGVIVALEVARHFARPLELIVSKKIPFPRQPEFAIGAVSSDDVIMLGQEIPKDSQWSRYVDEQHRSLLEFAKSRELEFYKRAGYRPCSFKDKTVIVIDDGIATGMTALAALESARIRGAKYNLAAAPIMSPESYKSLERSCSGVITLCVPEVCSAVGQFYVDFRQTSDKEVVDAMCESLTFARTKALS